MGDTTFTLSGQAMIGHYDMTVSGGKIITYGNGVPVTVQNNDGPMTIAGVVYPAGKAPGKNFPLNIGGGELVASFGDKPWEVAGRVAMVIPDNGMAGTSTNATTFRPIFTNSNPIWEVTFPSITWHMNDNAKLVAETMFMFNESEAQDYDGNYVVAEMPGSATGTTYRAPNIQASILPIGLMMFQFQF